MSPLLGAYRFVPPQKPRPLLVPGQPEVRAHRLRFWDKGGWTDWREITVAPSQDGTQS